VYILHTIALNDLVGRWDSSATVSGDISTSYNQW